MKAPLRASEMTSTLIGSEILKIAADINRLKASGRAIYNFTVGDFNPHYFPIPETLQKYILEAYKKQETNYPPSTGMQSLRESVARFYSREFNYETKPSEVIIAGGARPLIFTTYATLLNPGETVVYPVPSWNNNHYVHLNRCKGIQVPCTEETGFLPTAAMLEPHIKGARLLCLNSPLNPSGTCFNKTQLSEICDLILAENKRRKIERPLYLMYDQIYFKLTQDEVSHYNPVELRPEMRAYTLFVDGLSKYFCGTGLRVGWAALPEDLVNGYSSVLGHVGAWAPRPEQVATAKFLDDEAAVKSFMDALALRVKQRIQPLYEGLQKLRNRGLPVEVVKPQGGIYLTMRLRPRNAKRSNEELRLALLNEAGVAIVPFQAFGLEDDSGWFRLSIGAVSVEDVSDALKSLEKFLHAL